MLSQDGSVKLQKEALKASKQFEEIAIWAFMASAIACTFAPLFVNAPKPLKTMLHITGVASGILASIAASGHTAKAGVYKTLENIEKETLKQAFTHKAGQVAVGANIVGQMEMIHKIASLPFGVETRFQLAKQNNLADLFVAEYGYLLPMPMQQTIDVPATDPSRVGAIAGLPAQPAMHLVPNAQDLQDALNPAPPYRDLSVEIADYDGHIAYVSKTRSGKTSSMIRSIQRSLSTGKHVMIIDGKGDDRLRAIQGAEYIHANDKSKIPALFATMDKVLALLTARQDGKESSEVAIDIYVDEYNLILAAAKRFGKWIDDTKGEEKWAEDCERILLQGAAANMRLRASAHTSRCEDWGWNGGVLDSVSFVALGRMGAYESIEDLIKYQVSERLKPQFKEDLERYRTMDFGPLPLVLTTLPPVEFCVLPKVEDAIAPPSSEPSGLSLKSDAPPAPPQQPTIKPRDLDAPNPTRQMFADFKAWYFANSPVDDETLRTKWLEVKGEDLTDHALICLRELLEGKR